MCVSGFCICFFVGFCLFLLLFVHLWLVVFLWFWCLPFLICVFRVCLFLLACLGFSVSFGFGGLFWCLVVVFF